MKPTKKSKGILTLIRIGWLAGLLFFVAIVVSTGEFKFSVSSSLVKKWFQDFSTEAMIYSMGMENPYYTQVLPKESKPPSLSSVMLQLATNLRTGDPRSLLGTELPGFAIYDSEIYIAGKGTNYSTLPIDETLPLQEVLKPNEPKDPANNEQEESKPPAAIKTKGRVVYIYHSHSFESFRPLLKDGKFTSSNEKTNIIAVGDYLKKSLEANGIGVEHDASNIAEKLSKRGWSTTKSYAMSREDVTTAMKNNASLSYLIDMHRDSQPRTLTTTSIQNKEYARLFFIVGRENPDYEKNLQLAQELHKRLNKKYPHISRGVLIKNRTQGNGVYNQDLSEKAMLVEMGGIDNDAAELHRTADAFAEVFSGYFWQADKVNGEVK
ncbi:stage II sporulation protein P [Fictibacillus macauensis ZFHKF-1]|uniref:Stage II sporulation protein P n=1 Tax=Fictibacillus macauensis ZFHKF-1 TaxID=1196324 RepID=I8J4M2_9BACL|nr:stage II sporulation protein P [Fictibacillus macauensis]EIT86726.1 stage II sporulation protein P [Fictibacillus macauensis ZFHKF-1]